MLICKLKVTLNSSVNAFAHIFFHGPCFLFDLAIMCFSHSLVYLLRALVERVDMIEALLSFNALADAASCLTT